MGFVRGLFEGSGGLKGGGVGGRDGVNQGRVKFSILIFLHRVILTLNDPPLGVEGEETPALDLRPREWPRRIPRLLRRRQRQQLSRLPLETPIGIN